MEVLENLVDVSFDSGAVEPLVCAYRANRELLRALVSNRVTAERAVFALNRAGDQELAKEVDLDIAASLDPRSALSAREREVYELLCAGLSNGEITKRLFITEGTVKVHVHHVFDKMGVRSRTALALNAANRRHGGGAETS